MKIICVGRNYIDHAAELNNPVPEVPVIFLKPETALCKAGLPVSYPVFAENLQYECEVVLRICKTGKNIEEKVAASYYDQWTVGIDFTDRGLQEKLKAQKLPWELAKAFDQSAAVGKWISFKKDALYAARFSLAKNGQQVQSGHTADLIFSFEYLISFISRYFTLQPGDLIFTGTPKGVGPVAPGDHLSAWLDGAQLLELEISGV